MHPRKNLIETFSSFIQFDGDRFHSWAIDGKLRRSMQAVVAKSPEDTAENIWAIYWYRIWLSREIPDLVRGHLSAYLQESCFWSASKTAGTFSNTQYKLPDCFQIAIAQLEHILKSFNPNQGSTLKSYAGAIFGTVIRETLRQRHEIDICTTWGILRKVSQKRLIEALEAAGLSADAVDSHVIAWNCFKLLYSPNPNNTTRKLSRPDDSTWNAITLSYNSQTKANITPQGIENLLLNAAKVTRQYLYPTVTSINATVGSGDTYEILDNIPSNEQESLLTEIIAAEEQENRSSQLTTMQQILIDTINQLEPQAQQILQLYYAEGEIQQNIAKILEIPQYTISRRLTKVRENLLKTLIQWSQEKLHISITPDLLKNTNAIMEEWLQAYYSAKRDGTSNIVSP
jgi:RNA polymerase sigma factor (sigma-70 family)